MAQNEFRGDDRRDGHVWGSLRRGGTKHKIEIPGASMERSAVALLREFNYANPDSVTAPTSTHW